MASTDSAIITLASQSVTRKPISRGVIRKLTGTAMAPREIGFLVADCNARVVITEPVLAGVATAVRDLEPSWRR